MINKLSPSRPAAGAQPLDSSLLAQPQVRGEVPGEAEAPSHAGLGLAGGRIAPAHRRHRIQGEEVWYFIPLLKFIFIWLIYRVLYFKL